MLLRTNQLTKFTKQHTRKSSKTLIKISMNLQKSGKQILERSKFRYTKMFPPYSSLAGSITTPAQNS